MNWSANFPALRKIFFMSFLAAIAISLYAAPDPEKVRVAAALQQAIQKDPNNAELWLHLGYAYRTLGDIDQSQSAFEKARALNPQNHQALYMLALIYEKKHQNAQALSAWKEYLALETDPMKRSDAEKHIHILSQ